METVIRKLREGSQSHVKVGVFDMDGILRGKYISAEKFLSAQAGGMGFCDVALGWDMNDQLYDNVAFTGWHTGYPDAMVRIVPDSYRALPFEEDMPFFLAEFTDRAAALCPRRLLQRVLDRADGMGYAASAGVEYEFFAFEETARSVREKNYRNLVPYGEGNFGYSVIRNSVHADFYQLLLDQMSRMGITIEGLHEETGPGVMEAALAVDDALAAADKAALFKTFAKVLAQQNDKMITFMAKCSNAAPGQSGHIHLSLKGKDGKPAFHDDTQEKAISETMRHFIGGQQKLMPELLAMIAPTINSYSRMIPGFWAPTTASWGVENRTTALRAIPGSAKSQRVEYRIAAADANPYLALAAALASGLWGIENKVEPTDAVTGNAYAQDMAREYQLPTGLWDAAQRLKASEMARDWFGPEFVAHFAATREWEEREFRRHVTDWEMQRYFEII